VANPETQWVGKRGEARYLFVARAEITNTATSQVLIAPTGDLSHFGCYIETPKPFPRKTRIKIRIAHVGKIFTATGEVVYHTNEGMGIAFRDVESADQLILDSWLPKPIKARKP